ncbi:MAG: peptidylprolyl isomerase [Sphingomonadales bacterium]|nr:peptidylprolyl isomerase [Sphingomonadales bacterium]
MKKGLPVAVIVAFIGIAVAVWVGQSPEKAPEPEADAAASTGDLDVSQLKDPENALVLQLSTGGPVIIEMYPDKAPNHVARFKELSRQGFYDGVVFHRVIEGFMAQTGDPTGTGTGGSGQNIAAEFNDVPHERGTVSTARSGHPDSADSQFFIVFDRAPHLDGQYTAFGRVVAGMDYVDAITKGPASQNGNVPASERDSIVTARVAADVTDAE